MLSPPLLEQLSQELMRALRGDETQREFSKALGFGSNVSYAWESGRRYPEASVALKAAERVQPSFRGQLLALLELPSVGSRLGSPRAVHRLLQALLGEAPIAELADQVDVDRNTLSRWLRGATEPRLPDFLQLLQVGSRRLLDIVALLVEPEALPSTKEAFRHLRLQQRLAYDLPWSHAVLRALELSKYREAPKHCLLTLATSIGLSTKDTDEYLQSLAEAGQVEWDGTHYVATHVMTVDTRSDPEANLRLKEHWARVGLQRLEGRTFDPQSLFSFNLFAVDDATLRQIRTLHLDYYERVRALIQQAEGTDRVVLLNQQLLPLDLLPGS